MSEVNATPHEDLIADLMNPNKSRSELGHAAVREIERLQEALAHPVLQDIEQYRMQMAGICTAALGYWTEYDSISSDYDTVALRDVAKLYAKYDELYKAQQEQEPVAWGCNRYIENDNGFQIGTDEPELAWGKYAPDDNGWWPLYASPPQRQPLTDEEIDDIWAGCSNPQQDFIDMHEFSQAVQKAANNKEKR